VQADNQAVYNREAEHYLNRALFLPEFELLRLFRTRWPETDMLDLGVGAGRTALTFSPLARSYVGLDYAPRMIELCKARIPESETVHFVVGDATDLSSFADRRFDLILFSFNGIDCVGYEQRLAVLGEVRKRLKPDGSFFFSSHNLQKCPFPLQLPRKQGLKLFRWAGRCGKRLIWFVRQKLANRHIHPEEACRQGWAFLADGDHHFTTRYCYITPSCQVRQLEEAGLEVAAVYDGAGKPIDWRNPPNDTFISYLCRLPSKERRETSRG